MSSHNTRSANQELLPGLEHHRRRSTISGDVNVDNLDTSRDSTYQDPLGTFNPAQLQAAMAQANLGDNAIRASSPRDNAESASSHDAPILASSSATSWMLASATMPPFNKHFPDHWFSSVELHFTLNGVEKIHWFALICKGLPDEVANQVVPFSFTAQTDIEKFETLKEAILTLLVPETSRACWKAVNLPDLGDRKPSQLLADFMRLLNGQPFTEMNLQQYIAKMPPFIRKKYGGKSLAKVGHILRFARLLDDEVEEVRANRQQPFRRNYNQASSSSSTSDRHKATFHTKQNQPTAKPTSVQKPQQKVVICKYHQQYGANARNCQPNCTFAAGAKAILPEAMVMSLTSLFITCKNTGIKFLVDTGASISIIPPSAAQSRLSPSNLKFVYTAENAPIKILGTIVKKVHLGDVETGWKFYVAKLSVPILGTDFIREHGLTIDLKNSRLYRTPSQPKKSSINSCSTTSNISNPTLPVQKINEGPGNNNNSILSRADTELKQFLTPSLLNKIPTIPKGNENFDRSCFKSVQHSIETNGLPVTVKCRRLRPEILRDFDKELDIMLRMGVLTPSNSDWASPLHMQRKKDGSWRPCGDFRLLNAITKKDNYPVPSVLDVSTNLYGKSIFSKVDLFRGFWQIPMSKSDAHKTAIITPRGLYHFLRMPFGLRNAPATFQRAMDSALRGLEGVFCFADDILIASESPEQHTAHLQALFETLSKNNIYVALDKCTLFKRNLDFVGFTISKDGTSVPQRKVEAIISIAMPSSPKALYALLGYLNYYRRFVKGFATLAAPLYAVADHTNSKKQTWPDDTVAAFQDLKSAIAKAAMLAHPSPGAKIAITADASLTGIGGVLEEWEGNSWKPLSFFSRKLNAAQKNYSTYGRELLALYEATKYFRHFVIGADFTLYTDHKPLAGAIRRKTDALTTTQQRHLSFIAEYTSDIEHIAGKSNVLADALSRVFLLVHKFHTNIPIPTVLDIRRFQENDEVLAKLRKNSPDDYVLTPIADTYLWCNKLKGHRIYVPNEVRLLVFEAIHGRDHAGYHQTKLNIQKCFIWPKMSKDIKNMIKACIACQSSKIQTHTKRPIIEFPPPSDRFAHIHIDFVGELPQSNGFKYFITIIDRFTRVLAAVPVRSESASAAINALLHHWITNFGVPKIITTDRGSAFTSHIFKEWTNALNIKHVLTTSYNPQANGLVERVHRRIKDYFRTNRQGWANQLPWIVLNIRNSRGADADFTPNEAVMGSNTFQQSDVVAQSVSLTDRNFAKQMKTWQPPPSLPMRKHQKFSPADIKETEYVLVKKIQHNTLERPYSGPHKVLKWSPSGATVLIDDVTSTITRNRLKPIEMHDGKFLFK